MSVIIFWRSSWVALARSWKLMSLNESRQLLRRFSNQRVKLGLLIGGQTQFRLHFGHSQQHEVRDGGPCAAAKQAAQHPAHATAATGLGRCRHRNRSQGQDHSSYKKTSSYHSTPSPLTMWSQMRRGNPRASGDRVQSRHFGTLYPQPVPASKRSARILSQIFAGPKLTLPLREILLHPDPTPGNQHRKTQ